MKLAIQRHDVAERFEGRQHSLGPRRLHLVHRAASVACGTLV